MPTYDNPYRVKPYALSTEPELSIEIQKLDFLRNTELQIKKELKMHDDADDLKKKELSTFKRFFKKAFFSFLITFGLLEDAAGSYLYASALFTLIPGITNPVTMAMAAIFTILNCTFFYAFEVSILKEALGITSETIKMESLIDVYLQQLKITTSINQLLTTASVLTMDHVVYENYTKLAVLFNGDLKTKQKKTGSFHESIPRKLLKWGVIGFGLLDSICGSYFMSTSLLAIISAPLLGTPIGWLIISLTIIAGLGFYYAMGAKSMIQLVCPERAKYKELRKSLNEFKSKDDHDFDAIHSMHRSIKKVTTQDSQTQTEPLIYKKGVSLFSRHIATTNETFETAESSEHRRMA